MENRPLQSATIDLSGRVDDARIDAAVEAQQAEWIAKRKILTADELFFAKDLKVRLESRILLPGDSRKRNYVWLFSIDATVGSVREFGCLFANECILVQARGWGQARNLAEEGLRSTIEFLQEEANRLVVGPMDEGLVIEDAAPEQRETRADRLSAKDDVNPHADRLRSDPKMRSILAHEIGGLPWKW